MAPVKSNDQWVGFRANADTICVFSNNVLKLLLLVCIVALATFISFAHPLLQVRQNVQVVFPQESALLRRDKDGDALEHHSGLRKNPLASLNETLLAYAAIDPIEVEEERRVKMLLDFGSSTSEWDYGRGMNHNDTGVGTSRTGGKRRQNESWMLEIQKQRYARYRPRFRQLVQIWSRNKKYEPLVIEELMRTVKKTLDKFYDRQANSQRGMHHDGEPVERYGTCAVIGNSGILLNRGFGSFIDSHDVVIRLNNANLAGFEQFVGSKTTLSFVNSNVYHDWTHHLNCFCHPYGDIPIVMYLCQVQHLMDTAFCEPIQSAPVLVTDPRLDILCTRLAKWYSVKNYVEVTGNPMRRWARDHHALEFHYSSGFQAVVLALGICEKVDILGFGKAPGTKHHYHTNRTAELALHDYAAEYLFYDDLASNRTSSIPFLSETGLRLPAVTIYK